VILMGFGGVRLSTSFRFDNSMTKKSFDVLSHTTKHFELRLNREGGKSPSCVLLVLVVVFSLTEIGRSGVTEEISV
jgi:hypothetical protein